MSEKGDCTPIFFPSCWGGQPFYFYFAVGTDSQEKGPAKNN